MNCLRIWKHVSGKFLLIGSMILCSQISFENFNSIRNYMFRENFMLMDDMLFSVAFREMLKNTVSCSFSPYLSASNNALRKLERRVCCYYQNQCSISAYFQHAKQKCILVMYNCKSQKYLKKIYELSQYITGGCFFISFYLLIFKTHNILFNRSLIC